MSSHVKIDSVNLKIGFLKVKDSSQSITGTGLDMCRDPVGIFQQDLVCCKNYSILGGTEGSLLRFPLFSSG